MKKDRRLAVASLVLALIALIPFIYLPSNIKVAMAIVVICILVAVVGVVLGFLGKKQDKGIAIAGTIIGFVAIFILCITLFGLVVIKDAKDCVVKDDEVSTCEYMGQEIEIPNVLLTDDQMKEQE